MPCYSTVTKTKMKDSARLSDALNALGYTVQAQEGAIVAQKDWQTIAFTRTRDADAFQTTTTNLESLKAIQRKYSEMTVRDFAKRRGFAVTSEGSKLTLINRRG